jgi:hypothetical protein
LTSTMEACTERDPYTYMQLCFACLVSSTWLHAGAHLSGKRKAAAASERDPSRTFLLDVRVSRCDTITDVAGGCGDPHVRIASRLVESFTSVEVGRRSFRRGRSQWLSVVLAWYGDVVTEHDRAGSRSATELPVTRCAVCVKLGNELHRMAQCTAHCWVWRICCARSLLAGPPSLPTWLVR